MSEGEAGFVPQEATTPVETPKDLALKTVEDVKARFPDYSQVFDQFSKTGKIALFKEAATSDGKHAGINLLVTPTKLRYTLGYVEIKGKKQNWKYKNLPRIFQSISYSASSGKAAGIQMDHPPTDWEFESNDEKAKTKAYEEFYKVLDLLRLHEEF